MNQEKTYTLQFTENDIVVNLNLIDIAVKAAGRQAAGAAVHFEQKFAKAVEDAKAAPAPDRYAEVGATQPSSDRVTASRIAE